MRSLRPAILLGLLLIAAADAQEIPQDASNPPLVNAAITDEVDAKLMTCLTSLASYTRWMIAANPQAQPDKLHVAIDAGYRDVQSEWTGPYSARRFLLPIYLFVTCSYAVYFLIILVIRRVRPTRFPVGRPPDWTWEKRAIIGGVLILLAAALAERLFTFGKMQRSYARLSAYMREFVELRQPAQLANSTDDPCQQLAGSPNVTLADCAQDFAVADKGIAQSVAASRFLNRDLVKQRREAAIACAAVTELPAWFAQPAAHQVEYELALQRPLLVDGDAIVLVKDLVRITDLRPWLTNRTANAVRLKLQDAFAVGTAIGEPWAYQQKARLLLGPESHDEFAARYTRISATCVVIALLLLTAIAGTLWHFRSDELERGSAAAGNKARLLLYVGLSLSAVLAVGSIFVLGII